MPSTKSEKNPAILVAIITAVGAILVAAIQFFPSKQNQSPQQKVGNSQHHYAFAGTVVDANTNASIPEAEISIVGQSVHYSSEHNGNFRLQLDTTLIRVRVTKDGYNAFDESYDLPNETTVITLVKAK